VKAPCWPTFDLQQVIERPIKELAAKSGRCVGAQSIGQRTAAEVSPAPDQ